MAGVKVRDQIANQDRNENQGEAEGSDSGCDHRLEMARTKPFPQRPMSLQMWQMILFPSVEGAVASPVR